MLSYQHGYHAGCFADVVKHIALMHLLDYLTQKEAPLLYLDAYAGRGAYDLMHKQSLKTGEAASGIIPLWAARAELPAVFKSYIDAIQAMNEADVLRYYPGSPAFALHALRPTDRTVFCELHSGEHTYLDALPQANKKTFIHHDNGLNVLHALLPPIEKRGLIFIDPAYELQTEYRMISEAVQRAYKRFETGVYCIWYPILSARSHSQLTRGLSAIKETTHLNITFNLHKTITPGMGGCGLWIINPPYTLAKNMKIVLETLTTLFNPGQSSYRIDTL